MTLTHVIKIISLHMLIFVLPGHFYASAKPKKMSMCGDLILITLDINKLTIQT